MRNLDYQELVADALRSVVRSALLQVAENGLPGDHHFFLTFLTDAPGVELPPGLRNRFPAEMTIILQHQFWNLVVETEAFAVTLRFDGMPQHLRIPFAALTAFVDPEAEFGLQLRGASEPDPGTANETASGPAEDPGPVTTVEDKVVSLDQFRKKK